MHGAVLSSAAQPESDGDGTLSVDGFVSDVVLGSSERCCITALLLTALTVTLTSPVEVCLLHSGAAALDSWVVTCNSSVTLEALLRWAALVSERSAGPQ